MFEVRPADIATVTAQKKIQKLLVGVIGSLSQYSTKKINFEADEILWQQYVTFQERQEGDLEKLYRIGCLENVFQVRALTALLIPSDSMYCLYGGKSTNLENINYDFLATYDKNYQSYTAHVTALCLQEYWNREVEDRSIQHWKKIVFILLKELPEQWTILEEIFEAFFEKAFNFSSPEFAKRSYDIFNEFLGVWNVPYTWKERAERKLRETLDPIRKLAEDDMAVLEALETGYLRPFSSNNIQARHFLWISMANYAVAFKTMTPEKIKPVHNKLLKKCLSYNTSELRVVRRELAHVLLDDTAFPFQVTLEDEDALIYVAEDLGSDEGLGAKLKKMILDYQASPDREEDIKNVEENKRLFKGLLRDKEWLELHLNKEGKKVLKKEGVI